MMTDVMQIEKNIELFQQENKTDSVCLLSNERLDDLQCKGYKLIQNTAFFCFGIDAVLLSSFASAGKGSKVLDLGTGNGVIPILMYAKNENISCVGLEIQEQCALLAKRNTVINNIEENVKIVKGDIKEAVQMFGGSSFDVVTSNPPYMNENHGIVNPDSAKAIARHELLCSLDDVIRAASGCLKVKGHFFIVHRPQRLVEIFETMRKYKLEPKRMRMVHPYEHKAANMVLIEAVKCGNAQLITEPPLIVYNSDGSYTTELRKMYGDC